MGIHKLFAGLKRKGYVPYRFELKPNTYKIVAVDTRVFEYKANYSKSENNPDAMIKYFANMISLFVEYKIYPIFIFDGKPAKLKNKENLKRREQRKKRIDEFKDIIYRLHAMELPLEKIIRRNMPKKTGEPLVVYDSDEVKLLQSIGNDEVNFLIQIGVTKEMLLNEEIMKKKLAEIAELKKLAKTDAYITLKKRYYAMKQELDTMPTPEDDMRLKKFLSNIGIFYIVSNYHDAENLCGWLQKKGYVDYVLSTDSDVFVSGASCSLFDYERNNNFLQIHLVNHILETLEMNMKEFINLCILLGTDYNDGVYGYGFVKSYKAIVDSDDDGEGIVKELIPNYNEVLAEFNYEYKIGNGEDELSPTLLLGLKQGAKFMLQMIKKKMNIKTITEMITDESILDICSNIYTDSL